MPTEPPRCRYQTYEGRCQQPALDYGCYCADHRYAVEVMLDDARRSLAPFTRRPVV